jgi:hypothetical protein
MNILTREGYFERFWQLCKGRTYKQAYELLEDELDKTYGIYRYSSFESFEIGLYRWNHAQFK